MTKKDIKIFKNIPTLYTDRLKLRRITLSDLEDVYEYSSDPEVSRYLLWSPHQSKLYTRDYLINLGYLYSRGRFYDWGIEFRGKMIGTVGFTSFNPDGNEAEIGYVLNTRFRGNGIAGEAVRKILSFGFEVLKLDKIIARYMSENVNSLKLALSVGMTENISQDEYVECKGKRILVKSCSIEKNSYFTHYQI